MDFQKVSYQLTGLSPLLMESPKSLEPTSDVPKGPKKDYGTPREDASTRLYDLPDGHLCVPASAVRGCAISGGKGYRVGSQYVTSVMRGALFSIEDIRTGDQEWLGLYYPDTDEPIHDWVVDSRRVVIKGASIIRHRPRIENWRLYTTFVYDADHMKPTLLQECLERGGVMVGILGFRPECSGIFGRFSIELLPD